MLTTLPEFRRYFAKGALPVSRRLMSLTRCPTVESSRVIRSKTAISKSLAIADCVDNVLVAWGIKNLSKETCSWSHFGAVETEPIGSQPFIDLIAGPILRDIL